MTDVWSERAEGYRQSREHRSGPDLELLLEWAEGETALDVATGGGHAAQRLRDAGFQVTTLDPSPGMAADILAPAEQIPFTDASFDVVVSRIAPHHFEDIATAVAEMARVSRGLVIVIDNEWLSDRDEEAARLRDPTHVRCYGEREWRDLFGRAGLEVADVRRFDVGVEIEPWLARTGCAGADAKRVRELVADRVSDGHVTVTRIAIKGRKR